jgi:glycosidase
MEGGDEPTTRGDFPGGFPGDKRDAFTAAGRTKDQQELFEFIRRLTRLRYELPRLQSGELVNLYVAEQQYAYARTLRNHVAIVVFNNDNNAAAVEFEVAPVGLSDGEVLRDRLAVISDATVREGKLRVSLPKRSVAILVSR